MTISNDNQLINNQPNDKQPNAKQPNDKQTNDIQPQDIHHSISIAAKNDRLNDKTFSYCCYAEWRLVECR